MPPVLRFIIYRLISIPITLLIITSVLYGFVMLTPPEVRATLYLSEGVNFDRMSQEQIQRLIDGIIKRQHLAEPFPVQYGMWAVNMLRGNWGWSPVLNAYVLPTLLRRSPATAELAIYTLLFFIPLGLISGVKAGSKKNSPIDTGFRATAFIVVSLPIFVLAIVLLSIFYVALYWFPPERLGIQSGLFVNSPEFQSFTGLLTIDGLLNGRVDISLEALQHLVLPVVTLGLGHWAMLMRVTRSSVIEEQDKEYIIAARARGIDNHSVTWKHTFRNVLTPSLTSSMLSAAALFTGVFVVEVIFSLRGISSFIVASTIYIPDATMLMGFAVYSVLVVLILMFGLDLLMALLDPRVREGTLTQ